MLRFLLACFLVFSSFSVADAGLFDKGDDGNIEYRVISQTTISELINVKLTKICVRKDGDTGTVFVIMTQNDKVVDVHIPRYKVSDLSCEMN